MSNTVEDGVHLCGDLPKCKEEPVVAVVKNCGIQKLLPLKNRSELVWGNIIMRKLPG
jgi:hypothetical protein